MTEPSLLYTFNFPGNVHTTADAINRDHPELIDYVVSIDYMRGVDKTVVLVRMPKAVFAQLKRDHRL